MAKLKTLYVCQQCGSRQPKWLGRCPDCGEWNTMVETVEEAPRAGKSSGGGALRRQNPPQSLAHIKSDSFKRLDLRLGELNRVLGGGLVPGSLVLIGGDPGIGKSTLLLQICGRLANGCSPILYVSGEESAQQLKMRAQRLGIEAEAIYLLTETNLEAIVEHIDSLKPALVVIDSIQTVYLDELESAAGSISQVRESAARLQRLAKNTGIPIFLIGHVTKEGAIAGPRVMEHIVDVVLYLEGDRFHTYRLLRSVKNRYGATSEVGVFEMGEGGLAEVSNPSEVFLAERLPDAAGSAIVVTMEGTRPLLLEVQALSSTTSFGNPRRTANGVDFNRLLLLTAVLSKRVGLRMGDQDIFVNVVGGCHISEPAADLAVAAAIASSYRNLPLHADMVFAGEVGLSGELRACSQLENRLKEAAKLGFRRAVIPNAAGLGRLRSLELELLPARTLVQALQIALNAPKAEE